MHSGSSFVWRLPFSFHPGSIEIRQQLLTVRLDGRRAIEAVICGARVGEATSERFGMELRLLISTQLLVGETKKRIGVKYCQNTLSKL